MENAPGSLTPEDINLLVPKYVDDEHESAFMDVNLDFTDWSWFILGWMPATIDIHLRLVVDWAETGRVNVFDSVPITAYTIHQALDRLSCKLGGTDRQRVLDSCKELEVWNDRWAAAIFQPEDSRAVEDRLLPVRTVSELRKAIADVDRNQPDSSVWFRFGLALGTWWAQDLLDRKSVPKWDLIVQAVREIPISEQALSPILQALGKLDITDNASLADFSGCFPRQQTVATAPLIISDSDTEDRNTNAYRYKKLIRHFSTEEIDPGLERVRINRRVFEFALVLERSLLAVPRQVSKKSLAISKSKPENVRPQWDNLTRTLTYDGVEIRKVVSWASTVIPVYNAFQEAGWPPSIEYQAAEGKTKISSPDSIKKQGRNEKNNVVFSLNSNLKKIRFYGDGGTRIRWTRDE